jgi:hypothetical protein
MLGVVRHISLFRRPNGFSTPVNLMCLHVSLHQSFHHQSCQYGWSSLNVSKLLLLSLVVYFEMPSLREKPITPGMFHTDTIRFNHVLHSLSPACIVVRIHCSDVNKWHERFRSRLNPRLGGNQSLRQTAMNYC